MKKNVKYIVSWSGGKDCMLAMHRAMATMGNPIMLFSSVPYQEGETLAHGYRDQILKKQADALNLPIQFMFFHKENYRQQYLGNLKTIVQNHHITHVVYGDLYLNEHRVWIEDVCQEAGLTAVFPCWIKPEEAMSLAKEFINEGYQSIIVHSKAKAPGKEWLGKVFDHDFISNSIDKYCPMGENGEFHSLVLGGPIFIKNLTPITDGIREEDNGFTLNITELKY